MHQGSAVEFLCTSTDGKASIWSGAGNLMYADIFMHEVDAQLAVSGAIGSSFAMNLTFGNTVAYKDIVVKANGKEITPVRGVYTLAALAAKDMASPISYRVTANVYGVNTVVAEGETSFAKYLNALITSDTQDIKDRMLAQATLDYGNAAAKYFASGELTEEEKVLIGTAPATQGTIPTPTRRQTSLILPAFRCC